METIRAIINGSRAATDELSSARDELSTTGCSGSHGGGGGLGGGQLGGGGAGGGMDGGGGTGGGGEGGSGGRDGGGDGGGLLGGGKGGVITLVVVTTMTSDGATPSTLERVLGSASKSLVASDAEFVISTVTVASTLCNVLFTMATELRGRPRALATAEASTLNVARDSLDDDAIVRLTVKMVTLCSRRRPGVFTSQVPASEAAQMLFWSAATNSPMVTFSGTIASNANVCTKSIATASAKDVSLTAAVEMELASAVAV